MQFIARLHGVEAPTQEPTQRQAFESSFELAVKWAQWRLGKLTRDEKKAAYIRISRYTELKEMDIHPAVESGAFAITDYRQLVYESHA